MPKYSPTILQGSFASVNALNQNFSSIASVLNSQMLSRQNPTGDANQMFNDIDMNGNTLYNMQSSLEASSPVTRQDLADIQSTVEQSPVLADIANRVIRTVITDYEVTLEDAYGYIRATGSNMNILVPGSPDEIV